MTHRDLSNISGEQVSTAVGEITVGKTDESPIAGTMTSRVGIPFSGLSVRAADKWSFMLVPFDETSFFFESHVHETGVGKT